MRSTIIAKEHIIEIILGNINDHKKNPKCVDKFLASTCSVVGVSVEVHL